MLLLTLLHAFLPQSQAADPTDWLTNMRVAWEGVRSYRAEQRSTERVEGVLRKERIFRVTFRKPGEMQLVFGHGKKATRIYRSEGRFEGNARLLLGGRAGRRQGILTVGPQSPSLQDLVVRPLDQLGLGTFVDMFSALYGHELSTRPKPVADVAGGEAAWRVDLNGDGRNVWSRAEVALSQRTFLPVRVTLWDSSGVMLERHQWFDLKVNPDLKDDEDFDLGYPRP